MRIFFVTISLAALAAWMPSSLCAQVDIAMPDQGSSQASLDSVLRLITKRTLSDTDKKEIRACDREKIAYLKECRLSDPKAAKRDELINEAKRNNADPNSPDIQALLEKKFALEKACDDQFRATPRGKQCLSGEQKRQKTLEKVLQEDKDYQKWLQKVRAEAGQPSTR